MTAQIAKYMTQRVFFDSRPNRHPMLGSEAGGCTGLYRAGQGASTGSLAVSSHGTTVGSMVTCPCGEGFHVEIGHSRYLTIDIDDRAQSTA